MNRGEEGGDESKTGSRERVRRAATKRRSVPRVNQRRDRLDASCPHERRYTDRAAWWQPDGRSRCKSSCESFQPFSPLAPRHSLERGRSRIAKQRLRSRRFREISRSLGKRVAKVFQ